MQPTIKSTNNMYPPNSQRVPNMFSITPHFVLYVLLKVVFLEALQRKENSNFYVSMWSKYFYIGRFPKFKFFYDGPIKEIH
jgi:hypothetical protein